MFAQLFRISNVVWAIAVCTIFGLKALEDPTPGVLTPLAFWLIYLLASVVVFRDLRIAWIICITQLITVWFLVGVAVSDESFAFFTGKTVDPAGGQTARIMNTFIGILAPATVLIMLLIFSYRDIIFAFKDEARRRRARRKSRKARHGRRVATS